MLPKVFIGPMSKNIVDAAVSFSETTPIGFCCSRRQMDHDSGYVNNWTTNSFCRYVKGRRIVTERDHGGPRQGAKFDAGYDSFAVDAKNFDIIHVDPWKEYQDFYDGASKTAEYIMFCNGISTKPCFEIATEEAIRHFSAQELNDLILYLKRRLPATVYEKIKYVVIQSGTALLGTKNVGQYDESRMIEMIGIAKSHGLLSREHNGDYQPADVIRSKFSLGLDSINIAPEMGVLETKIILSKIDQRMFDLFYSLCFELGKWKKWAPPDFDAATNKEELVTMSGHYVFSDPRFSFYESFPDIKDAVNKAVVMKLESLLGEAP
jgi:hypothetical protein